MFVSTQSRNVPSLTLIEVSPFLVCCFFMFALLSLPSPCSSPRMVCWRHPLPPRPLLARMLPCRFLLPYVRPGRCRNFLIRQRPPSIFDGNAAVPPFTHQHLTLGWRVPQALYWEKSVLVPPPPVLADPALPLQSEYPVQFDRPRRPPMV